MKKTFKKISTFLAWAFFTFVSHFSAKQFLSSSKHLTENVIVLTSLQMAAGSVLYLRMMICGREAGEVMIISTALLNQLFKGKITFSPYKISRSSIHSLTTPLLEETTSAI